MMKEIKICFDFFSDTLASSTILLMISFAPCIDSGHNNQFTRTMRSDKSSLNKIKFECHHKLGEKG